MPARTLQNRSSSGHFLLRIKNPTVALLPAATAQTASFREAPARESVDALILDTPAQAINFDADSKLWASVIAKSASPDRARLCLELLQAQLGTIPRALVHDAALLVWASATTKDTPDSEGLIVPMQATLALSKLKGLGVIERAAVDQVLDRAGSPAERAVLLKTISARAARPVDETFLSQLSEVGDRIRGMSLEKLLVATTGYGIGRPLGWLGGNDVEGTAGNRQPDAFSCQLTARELAAAEFDPLIALRISMDPQGRSTRESHAGQRQTGLLEDFATNVLPQIAHQVREDYHPAMDVSHYLGSALAGAGIERWRDVDWKALDRPGRKAFLDQLEMCTLAGFKTLVRIERPRLSATDVPRHFEVIVDVRRAGETRLWRVHDPDPKSAKKARYVKDSAFLEGTFQKVGNARFKLERVFAVADGLPPDAPGTVLVPEGDK